MQKHSTPQRHVGKRRAAATAAVLAMTAILGAVLVPQAFGADVAPVPVPVPAPETEAAPPAPAPEKKPLPKEIPTFSAQDWARFLAGFLGSDPVLQKKAMEAFVDSGARGFNEMNKFTGGDNADLAARAKKVQAEINARSWEYFTSATAKSNEVNAGPLTLGVLQELQKTWMTAGLYTSQNALRQPCFQQASALQKRMQEVNAATREVAQQEAYLKQTPPERKLALAAIRLDRARALKSLNRNGETIADARQALELGGPEWRSRPAAMKLAIEALQYNGDRKAADEYAWRIIREHPRSLEVKFAFETLLDSMLDAGQYQQAIEHLKTWHAAFPLDADADARLYSTLETLMGSHEYDRVLELAEWMIGTLPRERLQPEAPKFAGGISEYVQHDYARAEKYYRMLESVFGDMFDPKDMQAVLERLKAKAGGTFPKEPAAADAGPVGALAKFLQAIRARDFKAAAALAPKDSAEDYASGERVDELAAGIVFADYAVKKVDVDEAAGTATITLDYYEAGSATPQPMTQEALKEDGAWKIDWFDEATDGGIQLQPAGAPGGK